MGLFHESRVDVRVFFDIDTCFDFWSLTLQIFVIFFCCVCFHMYKGDLFTRLYVMLRVLKFSSRKGNLVNPVKN